MDLTHQLIETIVRLVPKTLLDKWGVETPYVHQYLVELHMVYSDNKIPQSSEKESTTAEYTNRNISTSMNLSVGKRKQDY